MCSKGFADTVTNDGVVIAVVFNVAASAAPAAAVAAAAPAAIDSIDGVAATDAWWRRGWANCDNLVRRATSPTAASLVCPPARWSARSTRRRLGVWRITRCRQMTRTGVYS